jgi:predicted transcriptional regulator YdeE
MNLHSVQIDPITLVGIGEIGPSSFNLNSDGAGFGALLWQKFFTKLSENNIPIHQMLYGVSWPADEKTPPDLIHYFVGLEKSGEILSKDFSELDLKGGNYFSYRYQGAPASIDAGFQDAYMNHFPKSGLEPRDGQHLEIYSELF